MVKAFLASTHPYLSMRLSTYIIQRCNVDIIRSILDLSIKDIRFILMIKPDYSTVVNVVIVILYKNMQNIF